MSDPLTKAQRAFIAINKRGDLPAAVQLARSVIISEFHDSGRFNDYDDTPSIAHPLAGELDQGRRPAGAVDWDTFCAHVTAGVAMGIALGQLLHPDLFKAGGAK